MVAQQPQRAGLWAREQRSSRRYPIVLDMTFKLRQGRMVLRGTGKTRDISSRGILFQAEVEMARKVRVELCIAWPVLLNEDAALSLYVTGQTVRSENGLTAIRITRHTFRVRSRR